MQCQHQHGYRKRQHGYREAAGRTFFILLVALLVKVVEAQRADLGAGRDARNLCTQVVGLVAFQ